MTRPLAVNASKSTLSKAELPDTPATSVPLKTPKPRYIRFARAVSNILAPATVSVPLILLVAFYRASSAASALVYAAITLFFASIGPFAYILLGVRLGKLSDVDVSKRSERVGPFIFGLISLCLGWFVLVLIHGPSALITLMFMAATSGLIMLLDYTPVENQHPRLFAGGSGDNPHRALRGSHVANLCVGDAGELVARGVAPPHRSPGGCRFAAQYRPVGAYSEAARLVACHCLLR